MPGFVRGRRYDAVHGTPSTYLAMKDLYDEIRALPKLTQPVLTIGGALRRRPDSGT